ncbi:MAG: class I tRNA ligase family protein [Minisyncoccia bacterium]
MNEKAREDKSLLKEPLPLAEEKVLSFWKEQSLLEKIENKKSHKGEFVFYEGPPTANGRPGIHHLLSRAFKDVVLRYKTMQGFHVRRRGGWDTHGLPVELQVEKEIGTKSKKDIETFGIANFNEKCKESVWTYVEEWERFTDRIGYMLDQKNAYVTYKPEYIESIWNIVSKIADQNLLYKDYKVVPWCPRCGTALSSHELAQGYQDDKDLSVYIKFPIVGEENTFFLAWTTTPWTLPGHVALAVGKDIEYVEVIEIASDKIPENLGTYQLSNEEKFILSKDIFEKDKLFNTKTFRIVRTIKGKNLVGKKYLPPYDFLEKNIPESEKVKLPKAFQVYEADFVNTEDGTGIVHTAVMYGQDDFVLGTKLGLPKYHLVDETGHFVKGTGFLEGRFVKEVDENGKPTLAVDIINDLKKRNFFFAQENVKHSYPHCWRCKTPLIYYARDSWYIAMSQLRDKLISENKKINWEPEYIKEGRFGEWLSDVKDWAISRERYWGTPLPIWEPASSSQSGTKDDERIFVDSVETLKKYTKKSGNKYFVMRHGGTEGNKKEIVSFKNEANDHLTEDGKKQTAKTAKKLSKEKIDYIFVSPFARTKETAEIVRANLGLAPENVIMDERLREINPGDFDGKNWDEYHTFVYRIGSDWFERKIPNGESLGDVKRRVADFLYEVEGKYKDKKILFITHGGPAWVFYVNAGLYLPNPDEYQKANKHIFAKGFERFSNAEVRELPFVPLPHDKNFELDLHKPFIDEVVLVKDGKEFKRVKEVMDVWFDSGAMPFAQDHYPFENKSWLDGKGYPADYICEAVDQTRGWFYTLHAIGNLMKKGHAFKNVICLGLILDKEGKKMSKSVGNVVDPWVAMSEFGADPIRMWMFAAKEPGEPKNFDPESVRDLSRKVFALLTNVYSFYEMYGKNAVPSDSSRNVLDRWILSRLNETAEKITKGMDAYKVVEPARAIRDFIGDFSQWYLRRSRDRFKSENLKDAQSASETTKFVFHTLARLMAPFTPFYAEMIWQNVRTEKDALSVHLAEWPRVRSADKKLNSQMDAVRDLVSKALEVRSRGNIKIRQPLGILTVKNKDFKREEELVDLIKDELNVKEIIFDDSVNEEIVLDLNITPELKAEGDARELLRAIQEKRKGSNFTPKDVVNAKIQLSIDIQKNLEQFLPMVKKQGNIKDINFTEGTSEPVVEELTIA